MDHFQWHRLRWNNHGTILLPAPIPWQLEFLRIRPAQDGAIFRDSFSISSRVETI